MAKSYSSTLSSAYARTGHSACVIGCFAALFLGRLYFATQIVPAPVGDSATDLEPIYNYCHSGNLVSYLVPFDPAGKFRFIWHGPLPPILYRLLAKGCDIQFLYELRSALFLIIPITLLILVRRGIVSNGAWFCLSIFCLAASEKVGFRPEHIAIIFVVLAYISRVYDRITLEGVCSACIFLSSPIAGCLYAITRASDSSVTDVKDVPLLLVGAISAAVVVFFLYPYPFADWLGGMLIQAKIVSSGSAGDIYTYFIRSDFLPFWGLSLGIIFVAAVVSAGRNGLKYVALLPFIWYFGLRRPTTSYNLLTTVVLLYLQGYPVMSRPLRAIAGISLLVPGLLGLAQLSWRDEVSMLVYPDSFNRTRLEIAGLSAEGERIIGTPSFAIFTNPELRALASGYSSRPETGELAGKIVITQNSGSGGNACPKGTTLIGGQPKRPWWFLFKSSSSWAVNVCRYLPALAH